MRVVCRTLNVTEVVTFWGSLNKNAGPSKDRSLTVMSIGDAPICELEGRARDS